MQIISGSHGNEPKAKCSPLPVVRKKEMYSFTIMAKKTKFLILYNTFFFYMLCKKMLGMPRSLEEKIAIKTLVMDQRQKGVAGGTACPAVTLGMGGLQEAWHALNSVTAHMKSGNVTFTGSSDLSSLA